MKMKADLNETRKHEKQMWTAVNAKRDVNHEEKLPDRLPYFYSRN